MIDEWKIWFNHLEIPEVTNQSFEPFEKWGLNFEPRMNNGIIWYGAQHKGLFWRASGSTLKVANSVHKYAMGNNYCDFTCTQLIDTILELDNMTDGLFLTGKVSKAAFGVNFTLADPSALYSDWLYCRTKEVEPMKSKGRQYGSRLVFSETVTKGYSKTLEQMYRYSARIPPGIGRFETVYLGKWLMRNTGIETVADLIDKRNLAIMAKKVYESYERITRARNISLSGTSLEDIKCIALFQGDPKIIRHVHKEHKRSYYRCKNRYDLLCEKVENDLEVGQKLSEKLDYLVSSAS